eukprot:9499469-Pyramimonas_sp.AAC.1
MESEAAPAAQLAIRPRRGGKRLGKGGGWNGGEEGYQEAVAAHCAAVAGILDAASLKGAWRSVQRVRNIQVTMCPEAGTPPPRTRSTDNPARLPLSLIETSHGCA